MIQDLLAVKLSTLIPGFFGALVYSMRVGTQSWTTRLVGLLTGVVAAYYLGPAAAEYAEADTANSVSAIVFLVGAGGVGIIEVAIGVAKDPIGVYNKLRKNNDN